jgi:subfamily B ATP-binding cassette protein HlyB/CyaB
MIASQISQPVLRMAQLWQDYQQARVSVDRIGDILNHPTEFIPKSPIHPKAIKGALRFEAVNFSYRSDGQRVLQDLSFLIQPGEVVGIIGPSGSGKSTLAKLIHRLYLPQNGRLFLDGSDLSTLNPGWLRKHVAIVLQESVIFNGTVYDNIALARPDMPSEAVIACAKISGADEFITKMPMGYSTMLEERGANLSGGQKQRIAIARALATNPRVLILDEATSALDFESELIIQKNMKSISHGRTVLVISHRLSSLKHCTKIMTIDCGRLVEQGTPSELYRNKSSFYYNLVEAQSHLEEMV